LLAVAARCRGLLAAPHASAHHFAEALDHHRRSPTPLDLARTHLCFADQLIEAGTHDDASHHLSTAIDGFTSLGARLWTDSARARLRSITRERSDSEHGLSPREEEVARLVASGASNKEVASALYVNAKTVEYHLANIYRKLGIRTRTDLALRWRRSGDVDGADPLAG
jgi:DNA-binding CsgD family transcriptional regulator